MQAHDNVYSLIIIMIGRHVFYNMPFLGREKRQVIGVLITPM